MITPKKSYMNPINIYRFVISRLFTNGRTYRHTPKKSYMNPHQHFQICDFEIVHYGRTYRHTPKNHT